MVVCVQVVIACRSRLVPGCMGFHMVVCMQVVMALLDLVLQHGSRQAPADSETNKKTSYLFSSKSTKFASEVSKKALNLMIILRPVTMVSILAKEVSSYLACQHVTHYPHSSIQPVQVSCPSLPSLLTSRLTPLHCAQVGTNVPPNTGGIVTPPERLLPASREEILDLMRTVIEKSQQKLTFQLLEVCAGFSV